MNTTFRFAEKARIEVYRSSRLCHHSFTGFVSSKDSVHVHEAMQMQITDQRITIDGAVFWLHYHLLTIILTKCDA